MPVKAGTAQELQVLVLGEAAAPTMQTLRDAGLDVAEAATTDELVPRLDAGAGAAVLTAEAFAREAGSELGHWLHRQPDWSDFPILVLTSRPGAPLPDANVRLLPMPLDPPTLVSAVRAALRDRMRQYGVRAEAELRQGRKMAAISLLTGGIAHDFNNLFTAVMGSLELIQARTRETRTEQLANLGLAAATRGARLIRQLLAFSCLQQIELSAVTVSQQIADMRDVLEAVAPAVVTLRLDLDMTAPAAVCDPGELETAILNLVRNACEAMPGGGILSITTGARREAIDGAARDVVVIGVTDTGHGMSAETMERAFEPFFTTKDIGRGSGLGLSQVYGLARQCGGAVALRSSPAGTTVELLLPRAEIRPPS